MKLNEEMIDQLRSYLMNAFPGSVAIEPHEGHRQLPPFMDHQFSPVRVEVLGNKFVGLIFKGDGLRQAMVYWEKPWLLDEHLGSERRVLIMQNMNQQQRRTCMNEDVPFVVPDSHLWLPFMGAQFDERRKRKAKPAKGNGPIRPATQALLLLWYYHGVPNNESLSAAAEKLEYSRMSMSRAFDEIEAIADPMISIHRSGQTRRISTSLTGKQIWEQLADRTVTPIKRTFHVRWRDFQEMIPSIPGYNIKGCLASKHVALAGVSAVAANSNLAPEKNTIYATTQDIWQRIKSQVEVIDPRDIIDDHYTTVQIWKYLPTIQYKDVLPANPDPHATWLRCPTISGLDKITADPLSVWLSLTEDERDDPRVEESYEEWVEKWH